VVCWVRDLDARWGEGQERAAVVVTEDETVATSVREETVPPAIVSQYLTAQRRRRFGARLTGAVRRPIGGRCGAWGMCRTV
jgi:hypothetical protein